MKAWIASSILLVVAFITVSMPQLTCPVMCFIHCFGFHSSDLEPTIISLVCRLQRVYAPMVPSWTVQPTKSLTTSCASVCALHASHREFLIPKTAAAIAQSTDLHAHFRRFMIAARAAVPAHSLVPHVNPMRSMTPTRVAASANQSHPAMVTTPSTRAHAGVDVIGCALLV